MRVLFVDDEKDFLSLMENRLEKRGITIYLALSGDAGIEILEEKEVDVVVLDVTMSGMDGMTTLSHIKNKWPELPVLFLSGHANPDVAMASIECGAVDYLIKPVALNDLIERLRELVARK